MFTAPELIARVCPVHGCQLEEDLSSDNVRCPQCAPSPLGLTFWLVVDVGTGKILERANRFVGAISEKHGARRALLPYGRRFVRGRKVLT